MTRPTKTGAVIYTRVSSKDQVENYSLETQERACRDYATREGYDVIKVFTERGESAKTSDRTELQAMLKYVEDNARLLGAVIVYKVDRLARNSTDHGNLRIKLRKNGVFLQSATQALDDTPSGRLIETIFAAIAQEDNENRADQSKKGMIAAVASGRFVWPAPIGYVNGHSKSTPSLVPDVPSTAKLVQSAWNLVESGMPLYEARTQLVREGLRMRSGRAPSPHAFRTMLKSETYIGYINAFGRRIRGDFEPLVDAGLFWRVQELLAKSNHTVARPYRKVHPDFPLRGTVLCPHCGQPLTAAWSRGHGGRYGYYRCTRCRCVSFRKDSLEPKFVNHLNKLSLTPSRIERLRKAMEADLVEDSKSSQQAIQQLDARLNEQQKRRDQIIEKSLNNVLLDDDARRLREEADRAIQEIEAEKRDCLECQSVNLDIVTAGLTLLDRMGSLWTESEVATRKRLQRFVFPYGMSFDGSEFGTTVLPACLQFRGEATSQKRGLVRPTGFEPVIYGSGGHCLIQLGHGRARRQV